jgi:peroxiredoxin Q/BCP
VAERYGVWVEKRMYRPDLHGRAAGDVRDRAPDGSVAHVLPRVSSKTHDDEVLAALGALAV